MEEIKKLIQAQGDAFAEYKKTMDAQLAELKKGGVSADTQAKMDKILADYDKNKENMDKIHADLQTLKVSPAGSEDSKVKAHREAFHAYCRRNDPSKMMNLAQVGVDADGGYTCPAELSNRIISIVEKSNPIRQLATVETPTSGQLDILTDPNEMTASRIAEAGTRSETSTPQVGKISIVAEEMYCYPKVTQRLLEDSAWDFENWLVGKASRAFSALERTEMATGNGVGCSEGITSTAKVADASWAWASGLGFITTGQPAAISTDGGDLISIVDALEDAYKLNAAWIFNKAAFTSYRKLRAGANAANMFLFWTPSLQAGVPDRFLDYPVHKMSTMPSVAANAYIAAFGDLKAGYTICDRTAINVIRDNITSPGFVKLHMRRRSTGRVTNFEAIKLLKCAA